MINVRSQTMIKHQHQQVGSLGPCNLVHAAALTPRIGIASFVSCPATLPKQTEIKKRLPPVCARRPKDPVIAPVIAAGPNGEDIIDLNSHLMRNRIIFLGQRIDDKVATQVVASLLALNSIDDKEEIKMYINCPAGSSYAVTAILDTMSAITAPISTVAFGIVGGTAVHVLAAGTKGKRFSMPSTRILLQQPNGGAMGSADEVIIQATELNRTMKMMYQFLSKYTGVSVEKIEEECDRENFMSPQEAIEFGLIDGVIS